MDFIKEGSKYVYRFVSDGVKAIQVNRVAKGYFTVYASLGGLTPVSVYCENRLQNLIFEINIPSGADVTLESETEVTESVMQ